MKMGRRLMMAAIALVLITGLALSAGATYAQGGGRGNGNGAGGNGGYGTGGYGAGAGNGYGNAYSNAGQAGGQYQAYHYNYYGEGLGLYDWPGVVTGDLTEEAIAALTAGLQDEYHAYAVYQAIIDQFGPVMPFVSIQRAEANHAAALEAAFTRYGLDVPAAQPLEEVPVFASLADACAAGAAAEIANFTLYDQWIDAVQDYPDLAQVFTALRDASEFNHLPAFEACAG